MATWREKQIEALTKKKPGYWIGAAITVTIGVLLGGCLGESHLWLNQRRAAYRWLYNLNPRKPHPQWVTLILIEDDEYWLGDLAGRRPTNRDYLARLTRAAAAAVPNPAVIALDFDLHSPSPDGRLIDHLNYREETKVLLDTIREIGVECPIIISKTLGPDAEKGYALDSDIHDGYDFGKAKVLKGYIGLPDDERLVPALPMPLQNGGSLDSFSGAIVRAFQPARLSNASDTETLPYGDFMNLEEFVTVSAQDVLAHNPSAQAALAHRLVIIGAHWHVDAIDRGRFVDEHPSPNGDMPGVALHANYVEAIMDSRLHPGWSPFALHLLEGVGAALVVLIFAFEISPMAKAIAVAGMVFMLVLVSAVSLLVLGLVFDFFVPVVSAIGHGVVERVLEWRKAALTCAAKSSPLAPAGNAPNPPIP